VRGKKIVPHRRRREMRTDYRQRLALLKSGLPRVVIRKSNRNVTCQVIEYSMTGDRCVTYSDSKELKKFDWKAPGGNLPAAYLTGLLCGLRAKHNGVEECVADMGLQISTKGSVIYACLKGFIEGGVPVSHSAEILPDDERAKGGHIAAYAEWLKRESASQYKSRFSAYLKGGVDPETLPEHFEAVKKKILGSKVDKLAEE